MPTKFFNLDRDPQLTANSDYFIASQKAVKTALDTKADKESTYTKEEVNEIVQNIDALPTQIDNAGKFLTTDGENASWSAIDTIFWANYGTTTFAEIYDKAVSGKFVVCKYSGYITTLSDMGSTSDLTPSAHIFSTIFENYKIDIKVTPEDKWSFVAKPILPGQSGNEGKALVTDGENVSWEYTSVINDVTNASETGLSKLVINKLSQEEYDNLLEQDAIQDNELYIINDGNSQYVTEEELQQSLVTKADVDNVYTKEEVYTKNEVDNIVSTKADQETTYTKTEVDNIVSTKADVETTYTKTEVDDLLANFEGGESLPEQTDNAGKALVTDGTNASWEYTSKINDITNANETGLSQLVINKVTMAEYRELQNAGLINENELYMTEELGGSNLPSQDGNEGKFLTTNGINPSWNYASVLNQNGVSTGLSQLVINEVTQEEYNALIEADAVKDDEIYMIQDVDTDYVTQSELETRLENIGGGNAGRNIGDIFYTTRQDTKLNGAVECNGATYNIGDFEGAESIGNLLLTGKIMSVPFFQYEMQIAETGYCEFFAYERGETFKVPTLPTVILKGNQAPVVGNGMTLGLTDGSMLGGFATGTAVTGASGNQTVYGIPVGTTPSSSTAANKFAYNTSIGVTTDPTRSGMVANLDTIGVEYRAMIQLYNSAKEIAIVDYTNQVVEAVAQGIQEIETAVSNGINTNIPVIDLGTVTGEQLLEVNKAYKMILNGSAISFNMDSVEIVADVVNQIKIYLQVKRNTTIDWGTTYFYNGTIPEITGGQYEIYYEYNHNLGTWVVGAMSVGVA